MTHQQRNYHDEIAMADLYNTIYTFTYKKQKRTYSQRHCPICYTYIKKNNVVLNCTHNCCFDCFYSYIEKAYICRDFPICFICRKDINQLDIKDEVKIKKIQDIRNFFYIEPKRIRFHYTNVGHIFINRNTFVLIQWFFLIWLFYAIYDTTVQYIYCYLH